MSTIPSARKTAPILIQAYKKTLTSNAFFYYLKEFIALTFPSDDPYDIAPYLISDTTVARLDNYYFFAHSGDKSPSPLIDKLYDYENDELSTTVMLEISAQFYTLFNEQMVKLWNTMQAEFQPTDNYSMTETSSDNFHSATARDATTTNTNSANSSGTVEDKRWGFDNAADAVDVDASETAQTSQFAGTNVTDDDKTYDSNKQHIMNRSGLNGIYSPADLVTRSLELWQINFYQQYLFPAIDKLIANPIY